MLAGVYDAGSSVARRRDRLADAVGPEAADGARHVGPLSVLSDRRDSRLAEARCIVEGSIYNLRTLVADLGHDPMNPPSAPVLLTLAHQRWGDAMLPRLRGDFALVAWDERADAVLLAQDQVGVGALFLARSDGAWLFASEIHHLLRLLRRTPPPDEAALVAYLAGGDPAAGCTLYAGIRRLGAGRRMILRGSEVDERTYWEPTFETPLAGSRLEVAAALRDAVVDAVAARTGGARSVGVTLSGGFDSSAVTAAAASVRPAHQTLRGYSTVFADQPEMDDEDLLEALATKLDIENPRFVPEPGGAVSLALGYAGTFGLPLSGPGWVTEVPLLRRGAADGVEVLLDGLGGDETFGPVPFLVGDRLRAGRAISAVNLIQRRFPGACHGVSWRATRRMLIDYGLRPAIPAGARRFARRVRAAAPPLFTARSAELRLREPDPFSWARSGDGPWWWLNLRHLLIEQREVAGLGDYVRHRSQWFGLDGRPPLFDLELTRLALRIPPEMRFDPHLDRSIAREAMAGLLPDEIRLSRRKSNLAPFYLRGLAGPDLPLVRAILGERSLELAAWLRRDALEDLLRRPPGPGEPGWSEWLSTIWIAVSAELWLRSLGDASSLSDVRGRAGRLTYAES